MFDSTPPNHKPSVVGVVPAAGCATRLGSPQVVKELLPLAPVRERDGVRLVPLIEFTLSALAEAGVARAAVVTSPSKPELQRVLGDGSRMGLELAYVVQAAPRGLAHAVVTALPWCGERDVCLALPDTVFSPASAPRQLCGAVAGGADLALGVFPTEVPQELGPVRLGPKGRVLEVLDKPIATELRNTWGLAAWSPRFSRFLRARCLEVDEQEQELALGAVFNAAILEGLRVEAVVFSDGSYHDAGTPAGIAALIHSRGVDHSP